jgi:hypothetical protein
MPKTSKTPVPKAPASKTAKMPAPKAPASKTKTSAPKTAKASKTPVPAEKTELEARREANRLRQQRFLENHREEINRQRKERYAARIKDSRCPRCGKKLRSTKSVLCKSCLEKAKEYNKKT